MSNDWSQAFKELAARPACLAANPQLRTLVDTRLLPDTQVVKDKKAIKKEKIAEQKLQELVESHLRHLGFFPRTEGWIKSGSPIQRGWYFHYNNAKHNPYLLDLLVWVDQGPCTEFELKVAGGHVEELQALIMKRGNPVFWNLDAVIKHLCDWMEKNQIQ